MGYALSTKLDATLRYASGLYGLGLSVLADIAAGIANAAAAQATANTANAAAGTAQTTANTANTAAGTVQTNLTAHIGTGGTAHAAASGSAAGFQSAAHFTRVSGVEDGAQVTSEARVRTALAAATAAISVNSQKISSAADPTSAQDLATKAYVDAVATGLDCKASVRVVDTVGVTLSGLQTVDGVSTANGDRVLRAVGTAATNGIYTVNSGGAWTRATDADTSAEVTGGMFTFVTEGTANADSGWVLTTNDAITLGTTPLQFTQFSGAGQITAGSGIAKNGNTLSVAFGATAPTTIGITNYVGTDTAPAHADHGHNHGAQTDGAMHAAATTSVAGFLSPTDKTKLDGVATGATALALSASMPMGVTAITGSVGVSTAAAHADHRHSHDEQTDSSLHAVATTSAAGFQSAADKTQINALAAGQAATVGRLTVDCILETPTLLTGTGAVDVDTAIKNDFMIVLGGATTLNFTAFVAGRQGSIWVKQDATGGRSLAWTVASAASPTGWTQLKDTGLLDLAPAQTASALTMYGYAMFTLGGTNYVLLSKSFVG